jgi:16S rRNA (cytidine1402-2'-O)-methyltransferase
MGFLYQEFSKTEEKLNLKPGLYIVSTPIGNIEDITIRAIKILRSVDYIICEHHEITNKLLKHYQIKTKVLHYNDDMPLKYLDRIYNIIDSCKTIALVSDAGTPTVSDPGYKIIQYVLNQNLELFSIPGPSSSIAALTLSGFNTNNFYFVGFLQGTEAKIKSTLEDVYKIQSLLIFFESPHRLLKTLEILKSKFGENCQISISKEITKFYEESLRGTIDEVISILKSKPTVKGEYVLIVNNINKHIDKESTENQIRQIITRSSKEGVHTKSIIERIHSEIPDLKISKNTLYKMIIDCNQY